MHLPRLAFLLALSLIGCSAGDAGAQSQSRPFQVEPLASFDEPWAMTFLPGSGQILVTEKRGGEAVYEFPPRSKSPECEVYMGQGGVAT